MTEKLKDAKKMGFAVSWVKEWIRTYVTSGTAAQKKAQIHSMLEEKFSHLRWIAVVYPPRHGFNNHVTNFGIHFFRLHHDIRSFYFISSIPYNCFFMSSSSLVSETKDRKTYFIWGAP